MMIQLRSTGNIFGEPSLLAGYGSAVAVTRPIAPEDISLCITFTTIANSSEAALNFPGYVSRKEFQHFTPGKTN